MNSLPKQLTAVDTKYKYAAYDGIFDVMFKFQGNSRPDVSEHIYCPK